METVFLRAHFSGERTNFQDAHFCSAETFFIGAEFSGKETYFSEATFSGELTVFISVKFSSEETYFFHTKFSSEETHFIGAEFSGELTNFRQAHFSGELTNFQFAHFSGAETSFLEATFEKEVDFSRVTFKERTSFWGTKTNPAFGSEAWAQFSGSRIEKPELFTFNTALLHPGWYINADVRKGDFTDVKWYGMPGGPEGTLDEEIAALKKRDIESPHALLSQACQRLSANAEENREYPVANEFYYWSMDALRTESRDYRKETWDGLVWIRRNWLRVAKRCGPATTLHLVWSRIRSRHQGRPRNLGLISTLYWALNGYGVRAARAFLVLLGLWAAFTTLYVLVDPSEYKGFGQGIGYLWQAAVYSLLAMARLNPEPTPGEPGLFQFLVGLEGILGPLQIALLALAIRRQVMR